MVPGTVGVSIPMFSNINISFKFPSKLVSQTLRSSWPLGVAAFGALIYTRIDFIILSRLLGDSAAWIYGAAFPFPQALIQLGNVPFMVALFPTLTLIYKEDKKRFKKAFLISLAIVALCSIPTSILVSLFSPILIPLIFGSKYDQAIPVLQILIFIVPCVSLWGLLYKILIIINRQKDYLLISIFGALVSVLTNYFFIPQFGVQGASIAALFTQVLLLTTFSVDVFIHLRKVNK